MTTLRCHRIDDSATIDLGERELADPSLAPIEPKRREPSPSRDVIHDNKNDCICLRYFYRAAVPSDERTMRPSTRRRIVVVGAVLLAVVGLAGAAGASGASLSTVNETVRVHAVDDATIEGTLDLDAGETVTLRVQSTGDTSPRFFRSADVSVGDNGRFVGEFDLSDLSAGATFAVTVTHEGSSIAEADGTVVAADVPVTPTPTAVPTETPTGTRTETTGPGFGLLTAGTAVAVAISAARRQS